MPHRDYSVGLGKEPTQHGWIATVPLAREGAWLFLYNDEVMEKRLVHIPFGTVFTMRSDVYHGGCLGSKGNCWMQIFIIVAEMVDKYLYLGHVSKEICINNMIYNPFTIDMGSSLSLVNSETQQDLNAKAKEIEDNYIFGKNMWPSVGSVR